MTPYDPDSALWVEVFCWSLVQNRLVSPGYQLLPWAEDIMFICSMATGDPRTTRFIPDKICLINSKPIQREMHLWVISCVRARWRSHFPLPVACVVCDLAVQPRRKRVRRGQVHSTQQHWEGTLFPSVGLQAQAFPTRPPLSWWKTLFPCLGCSPSWPPRAAGTLGSCQQGLSQLKPPFSGQPLSCHLCVLPKGAPDGHHVLHFPSLTPWRRLQGVTQTLNDHTDPCVFTSENKWKGQKRTFFKVF